MTSLWTCGGRWPSATWPATSSPSTCSTEDAEDQSRQPQAARGRSRLYLHLHESAIEGAGGVGRVENTRSLVTVDQIRDWCGHPDAQITVKPVIDLADHVHVDAYEVPDRIAEPVALRDHTCVFPWCSRPARRLRPDEHGCDCDHNRAPRQGRRHLYLPARASVPATSPAQDPRRLDVHDS